jgi:hypothetical protein
MVMPLVDENKPKCYFCHDKFDNIEKLREHQITSHKEFFNSDKTEMKREPAPGDVTVF